MGIPSAPEPQWLTWRLHAGARPTRRPLALLASLVLVTAGAVISHPATGRAAPTIARPFPDATTGVHSFLVFDYHISQPATVAPRYDIVWGADTGNVAAYHTANPAIRVGYYLPYGRDHGTFSDHTARPLTWWKQNHPDWVLYRCDRVTPAVFGSDPNLALNTVDPAVQAWQVASYVQPAMAAGFDMVNADNLDMSNDVQACGHFQNGQWVQQYTGKSDDPAWRADVAKWAQAMHQALLQLSHPMDLVPNLGYAGVAPSDPSLQSVLTAIDGTVDEEGFTRYGNGYLTDTAWTSRVALMTALQQQGKGYYVINQMPTVDRAGVAWAMASYLMGKGAASGVYVSTSQGYGGDNWRPEYTAPIGRPQGAMTSAQGVYWRTFSGGIAVANPSATVSHTVTLPAGATYHDASGNAVSGKVSLAAHSGIVLLGSSPSPHPSPSQPHGSPSPHHSPTASPHPSASPSPHPSDSPSPQPSDSPSPRPCARDDDRTAATSPSASPSPSAAHRRRGCRPTPHPSPSASATATASGSPSPSPSTSPPAGSSPTPTDAGPVAAQPTSGSDAASATGDVAGAATGSAGASTPDTGAVGPGSTLGLVLIWVGLAIGILAVMPRRPPTAQRRRSVEWMFRHRRDRS